MNESHVIHFREWMSETIFFPLNKICWHWQKKQKEKKTLNRNIEIPFWGIEIFFFFDFVLFGQYKQTNTNTHARQHLQCFVLKDNVRKKKFYCHTEYSRFFFVIIYLYLNSQLENDKCQNIFFFFLLNFTKKSIFFSFHIFLLIGINVLNFLTI